MAVYLAIISSWIVERQQDRGNSNLFLLPDGAISFASSLPQSAISSLIKQFGSMNVLGHTLHSYPELAMRHASGAIFQEAHYELVSTLSPDLFEFVEPARSKPKRGGVHFTPPLIARALAEQALARLSNISARERITVADIACGSGAFLLEFLRALERVHYNGQVTIVGRDSSVIATDMARFVLGISANEWPGRARFTLDISVGDAFAGDANFLYLMS